MALQFKRIAPQPIPGTLPAVDEAKLTPKRFGIWPLRQLVKPTKNTQQLRTRDGRFDIIGMDLGVRARSGAGPVWAWRIADDTLSYWDGDLHAFGSRVECMKDLARHIKEQD